MKDTNKTYDEKITDRAFSQSFWISIFSILLYVIMLCSVSYAWFTASLSSGGNEIKSASFTFVVTHNGKEDVYENPTEPIQISSETTIKIEMTEDSTVQNAYCVVLLNDYEKYTVKVTKGVPVLIHVNAASYGNLKLEPKWGLPTNAQDIIEESEIQGSLSFIFP